MVNFGVAHGGREGQPQSEASAHSYIFNEGSLTDYTAALLQGVALIQRKIDRQEQPCTGITPGELAPRLSSINIDQPLDSVHVALKELESIYLDDAIYFHHKRYMAHLNCPIVYPAILAELISSSINSSLDTWDQSVGATLIEQKLIDWTSSLIGFGEDADGVFTSGGTQSNLMAILLARDAYCARHLQGFSVKTHGLPQCSNRFRIFTSEFSHFSVQKSAAIVGLGYESVVSVSCDSHYKIRTDVLESEIRGALERGLIPIAVVATAGTTDFGSVDPLEEIHRVCKKYDIWMHTDAAYGCGLLASPTRKNLLAGIEHSDSVTLDFHKSFLQPVSCSAFIARDKSTLSVVTHHAEYLNPLSAEREGTPNLVNKSIQTTRRFDALKLWLTLRTMGVSAVGQVFDEVCALARSTCDRLASEENFEVIHRAELSTVVFRYRPPALDESSVNDMNAHIRKTLFRSGQAVVAGTKVRGKFFLKFTLLNPELSMEDINSILQLIRLEGEGYLDNRRTLPEPVVEGLICQK